MTNFNYSNSIARLLNAAADPLLRSPTISDRTGIAQRKLITIYFGSGTWSLFFFSSFSSFMHKPSISPWPVSWQNFAHAVTTRICLKQKNNFIGKMLKPNQRNRHEIAVQFWWTDVRIPYRIIGRHIILRVSSFQLQLITNDHGDGRASYKHTRTRCVLYNDDFYEYFQCK